MAIKSDFISSIKNLTSSQQSKIWLHHSNQISDHTNQKICLPVNYLSKDCVVCTLYTVHEYLAGLTSPHMRVKVKRVECMYMLFGVADAFPVGWEWDGHPGSGVTDPDSGKQADGTGTAPVSPVIHPQPKVGGVQSLSGKHEDAVSHHDPGNNQSETMDQVSWPWWIFMRKCRFTHTHLSQILYKLLNSHQI